MSKLDAICARLKKQTEGPAACSTPSGHDLHSVPPQATSAATPLVGQPEAGASNSGSRASRRKAARPQNVAAVATAARGEAADDLDQEYAEAYLHAGSATAAEWPDDRLASFDNVSHVHDGAVRSALPRVAAQAHGNSVPRRHRPLGSVVGEIRAGGEILRAMYRAGARHQAPALTADAGHAAGEQDVDRASLRQYAENAMSELIGLYGDTNEAEENAWGLGLSLHGGPSLSADDGSGLSAVHAGQSGSGCVGLSPAMANLHRAYMTVDPMLPLGQGTALGGARDNSVGKDAVSEKKKVYDYSKYMKKYNSGLDCRNAQCMAMAYKEHFHCIDCSQKIMVKKEEMIRHVKWHRKREDSLQHGFMRYSPLDDCSTRFEQCVHNHKQTHYHCIQEGCDKVYVSTSDVQMHANYHRKASAIIMEGFQRFRATEDCGQQSCAFYSQRTTHFHCRRSDCEFTFKNKADMEKHKTYHQKDDVLLKDNFKKFMKYEHCRYEGCHYSKLSNHIHCIRAGCSYVLHSTSQLYAHKRKHEKHDFEQAYKKFKDNQGNPVHLSTAGLAEPQMALAAAAMMKDHHGNSFHLGTSSNFPVAALSGLNGHTTHAGGSDETASVNLTMAEARCSSGDELNKSLNLPSGSVVHDVTTAAVETASSGTSAAKQPTNGAGAEMAAAGLAVSAAANSPVAAKDELWKKYLQRYTANDPCNSRCEFLYKDHYHCGQPFCRAAFKSKEGMREHARQHDNQERISELMFEPAGTDGCGTGSSCRIPACTLSGQHFHCKWPDCAKAFQANENVFARLEHHREHELGCKMALALGGGVFGMGSIKDGMRRRGRPPKYLKDAIPVVPKVCSSEGVDGATSDGVGGVLFRVFEVGEACPDELCVFFNQKHYHCTQPRCYHASDRVDVVNLHSRDFHTFIHIMDGYEFYDSNVNCRRAHCHNNKVSKHYHCVRPKCDYSFVRNTTMIQHEKRHHSQLVPPGYYSPADAAVHKQAWLAAASPINSGVRTPMVTPSAAASAPAEMKIEPVVDDTNMASISTCSPTSSAASVSATTPVSSVTPMSTGVPAASSVSMPTVAHASSRNVPSPKLVKATGTFFPSAAVPESAAEWTGGLQGISETGKAAASRGTPPARGPGWPIKEEPREVASPMIDHTALLMNPVTAAAAAAWLPLMVTSPMAVSAALASVCADARQLAVSIGMESFLPANNGKHCGRPFCKLKKRYHFHCKQCEQSFTDVGKAKVHAARHRLLEKAAATVGDDPALPSRVGDVAAEEGRAVSLSAVAWNAAALTPSGYAAFIVPNVCQLPGCIYRANDAAHYHCTREGCSYGASDASKLSQHTTWHDRIDKVTGSDFKLYSAAADCGRGDCEHSAQSAHFHCLLCPFICTDDKKVAVHRKHHDSGLPAAAACHAVPLDELP